ncbi:MAG: hypothetical protein JW993_20000 [Sedimentisphaerales bacterium]|nr:hypothetical protein [Sedimentisphaerales bacterium]
MQNDDKLTPMERELELALGGLKPPGVSVNRDRVMFRAGQASMRRRNHLWQGVSAMLVVLLLTSIVSRPDPAGPEQRVETVAYEPSVSSPGEPLDRQQAEAFRQYVRTRQAVLDRGIEALPASPVSHSSIAPPLSRDDLDAWFSST